jgi:hypothetical protein
MPVNDAIIWLCEALLSRRWNADALADEIGITTKKDGGDVTVQPQFGEIAEVKILQERRHAHPHTLRIRLYAAIARDELMEMFGDFTHTPLGAANALMFRLHHPDYPDDRLSVVAEGNDNTYHTVVVGLQAAS